MHNSMYYLCGILLIEVAWDKLHEENVPCDRVFICIVVNVQTTTIFRYYLLAEKDLRNAHIKEIRLVLINKSTQSMLYVVFVRLKCCSLCRCIRLPLSVTRERVGLVVICCLNSNMKFFFMKGPIYEYIICLQFSLIDAQAKTASSQFKLFVGVVKVGIFLHHWLWIQ